MEIIIYVLIFIMGAFFGSFFTLAVYRIPLGLDILYEHSFCPNCNTKLKMKDLIPIISYISVGGKCRYCKEKIRIRYLLLEILSGTVFLVLALSLKLNILNLTVNEIICFLFSICYIASLFIIAGIDKEKIQIQKSVLLFNLILSVLFMIYVCISKSGQVIYTYIILLALSILLLTLDIWFLKKNLHENYTIEILALSLGMIVFSGAEVYYYTVAIAFLLIGLKGIFNKITTIKKRKAVINTDRNKELKIPVAFYMSIANIFLIIIYNFLR
ncbi:MAG: prepilin peptidase [Clostridia bacterium]|jgi:prepilin signal peptidase PulO-like enzyme (type II secretory pathway)|nr:prepilin peptidase [Clostridia bacterium]